MRRLTVVVGTRPECIKVAPLVQALRQRGVEVFVRHTGQHADLWKGSGLAPDKLWPLDPDEELWGSVLVQGDTRTARDAAWAAETVIHLEAGVRSGNLEQPFPEEGYRREIDARAAFGFCATEENLANLQAEGFTGRAWVTGNTGVDALMARQRPVPVHDRHQTVVVTLHRRESWGEPMVAMLEGLRRVALAHPEVAFHLPLHPNGACEAALGDMHVLDNVKLGPPLAYPTFLNKLAHCQAVLTDSGGVQEDACTLGIPCVVAREVTDRPESVASGHALVAGRTADGVEDALTRALSGLLRTDPASVFGDGQAAQRIADLLVEHVLQVPAQAA